METKKKRTELDLNKKPVFWAMVFIDVDFYMDEWKRKVDEN